MKGPWSLGQVAEVTVGPDLVIRRVKVRYFNSGESSPHLTDCSVRSLVKLFSVDEGGWREDMELARIVQV